MAKTTDVAAWCEGVAWITAVDGAGSSLRLTVPEAPPVSVEPDGDGLAVSASVDAAGGALAGLPGESDEDRRRSFGALVREAEGARSGLLSCAVEADAVRIAHPVFADGMTRQAFLAAVGEVAKTARQIRSALEAWSAGAEDLRRMEEQAAEPEPAPAVETAPIPVPVVAAEPAPARVAAVPAPPATAPAPPAWTATHVVPIGGVQVWTTPDPSIAPATQLAPGAEVRLVERRADWAHVDASNGWSGWVDARLLVAR